MKFYTKQMRCGDKATRVHYSTEDISILTFTKYETGSLTSVEYASEIREQNENRWRELNLWFHVLTNEQTEHSWMRLRQEMNYRVDSGYT